MHIRHLTLLLASALVTTLAVAAVNLAVDPLQLFHGSAHPYYTTDSRMQSAGLIRSQEFDTAFIGTSIALYVRPSSIDLTLGGKSIKLAAPGMTSPEQRFVLETAISTRHPKRVIWMMDDFAFRSAEDVDTLDYLPADLYRLNPKGVAGYLLDLTMLRDSLGIAARRFQDLDMTMTQLTWIGVLRFTEDNLDNLNTVHSAFVSNRYRRDLAWKSFRHNRDNPARLRLRYNQAKVEQQFRHDAIDFIRAHPDVDFTIIFPPYSILNFIALREILPRDYAVFFRINSYMLRQLAALPNVDLSIFEQLKRSLTISTNMRTFGTTRRRSTNSFFGACGMEFTGSTGKSRTSSSTRYGNRSKPIALTVRGEH
ncbi:hypothetical protein [Bradyrhizobium betae]|uniref:Uncharacterized protein n=1 Tax=Bradyrhizobium betae TaxID=244734 RepID=A0A4Q1US97_9BRAD|nr:hypothetical protein [Bradyrhizobium betae]RXT37953.1 hypothetical protein B5V03_31420 [Bradyrhizobium betae]